MGWLTRKGVGAELRNTMKKVRALGEADREMIALSARMFLEKNDSLDSIDDVKQLYLDCVARRQKFAGLGHFTKEWAVCAINESIAMAILASINGDSKTAEMIHSEISSFIENPYS